MPRFGERPHVSGYGRPDRALGARAQNGQAVGLACRFRSMHTGPGRSEPQPRRT
jgi:hypothetical protein